jgi:hypothetical protein
MESKNYHEDLSHIRSMMERSSRFISLSGLSGVFAGLAAILGLYMYILLFNVKESIILPGSEMSLAGLVNELIITGIVILTVALLSGYIFTANKSRRKGLKIWDATTKRLLITFAVPLVTGVFLSGTFYHHLFVFIAPATLLFMDWLVSAERYTLTDVKYLGYCQIVLGLISLFLLGWGLVFWTIGFGALCVYGLIMHKKYK